MLTSIALRGVQRPPSLAPAPTGVRASNRAIDLALAQVRERVHSTLVAVAGGYDMALLTAAEGLGYRLVAARSEGGAAFMAASLAWESERPVIAVVITSPGVYGTLQALHYACVSRVPLLLLSGESSLPASVQAGDGVGGPSVTRVTAPLTAWSADVTRAAELPRILVRAVELAAQAARPVHLNLPTHVASAAGVG